MKRTINGEAFEEVIKKLRKDFLPTEIKKHRSTNRSYIPADTIEKRLNNVLGYGNWDFVLSEPRIWQIGPEKKESCTVEGRLIIYDDDRVPTVRSAPGAGDFIYPKESNFPTSVGNAVETAARDSLKRCAKRFGVGILNQEESIAPSDTELFEKVQVLGPFLAMSKGGAKVSIAINDQPIDLVIWKDRWEKISQKHPNIFRVKNKINSLTFYGRKKEYKGNSQIEFIRFPEPA